MDAPATPVAQDLHTISLYVRNKPGVLVRVALVFSRRGFNIESLVVSAGYQEGFSRMTITCSGDVEILEQIIKQLAKLIDVVHAADHTDSEAIETEVALVKMVCPIDDRTEVLQIAEHFKAKVVDFGHESVILRLHGESSKLNAAIELLGRFQIAEIVRSGKLLMARGTEET